MHRQHRPQRRHSLREAREPMHALVRSRNGNCTRRSRKGKWRLLMLSGVGEGTTPLMAAPSLPRLLARHPQESIRRAQGYHQAKTTFQGQALCHASQANTRGRAEPVQERTIPQPEDKPASVLERRRKQQVWRSKGAELVIITSWPNFAMEVVLQKAFAQAKPHQQWIWSWCRQDSLLADCSVNNCRKLLAELSSSEPLK
mmetsp:Transcript_13157/g.27998  ORF Transcript_13157/g.27998 Transcript_13157/m.27998 type:complete len:200 (-) Transcript_13157:203-802(-)